MKTRATILAACILSATTQAADQPAFPDYYELTAWVDWAQEEIARLEAARIEDKIAFVILQEKLEAALAGGTTTTVDLQPVLDAMAQDRETILAAFDARPFVVPLSSLEREFARHQVKLRDLITAPWEKIEHATDTGKEKLVGKFQWRLLSNWPAPDPPDPEPAPDPEPDPDPLPDPVPGLIAPFSIRALEYTSASGPKLSGEALGYFGVGGWVDYQFETGIDATWQVDLTSLVPGEGGRLSVSIDGIQADVALPFSGKAWGAVTFTAGQWTLDTGVHNLRIAGTRASPSSQWGWIMDLAEVAVRVYQ